MKNLVRCLGIAALAAAVVLTMTACPPPDEPAPKPKGDLFIKAGAGGPFTNQELKADYVVDVTDPDYDGPVTIVWFKAEDKASVEAALKYTDLTNKDGSGTNLILKEDSLTYTPTATGKLIVAAYQKAGFDTAKTNMVANPPSPLPEPLFSFEFEVKAKGNDTEDNFFGNWKTTATFKPAGSPDGTTADENLVIDYTQFKLTSTYSTSGTKTGSDTHDSGNERIFWNIVYNEYNGAPGWTKLDTVPAGYDYGYKLTVEMYENWGYTAFTSFRIYKKTGSGTMVLTRTNEKQAIVRDYNKQP